MPLLHPKPGETPSSNSLATNFLLTFGSAAFLPTPGSGGRTGARNPRGAAGLTQTQLPASLPTGALSRGNSASLHRLGRSQPRQQRRAASPSCRYLVQAPRSPDPRHPPDTPVPPSTPGHAMGRGQDCKPRCNTWVWQSVAAQNEALQGFQGTPREAGPGCALTARRSGGCCPHGPAAGSSTQGVPGAPRSAGRGSRGRKSKSGCPQKRA